MSERAAVYARISDDREGAGLGVTRQRTDCEQLCARRGWDVVGVFTDNDISAYNGRLRPDYEAMLAEVEAGQVDVVVAWHPDRLHRSPKELERFIDVLEATGTKVETVTAGTFDLATPSGRMVARMLGAAARAESEHKSARIRRKAEELARAGKVGGGGTRPFGFESDRRTVRRDEAELIREAAERIAAGEPVRGVLADFERRGVKTVTGGKWRTTSLRRLLASPRVAGLRQHRGEVVGPAEWDAIVPRDLWERVRAVLADPERRKGGRPRAYLLTGGMAVCGRCGTGLVARPKDDGRRNYVCARGVDFDGCGKLSVLAEPLEELVADAVLLRVDSPAVRDGLRAASGEDERHAKLLRQLREDEQALEDLEVAHYTEGHLSQAGYLKARAKLTGRMGDARAALARRTNGGVVDALPLGQEALRAVWDAAPMDWRRRLVAAVVERVEVGPALKGRNRFDADRVNIVWRA